MLFNGVGIVMATQSTKHGEYLLIYWDDKTHEYIRGHVSIEDAQKTLDFECDGIIATEIKHTYAFWGVGVDECGDPCQRFYLRDAPARGRFKVTEISFRAKP